MVIAEDYRFLVAEDAVNRIENRIKGWSLPYPLNRGHALECVKRVRSLLMKLKYMYLPHTMLINSDELRQLEAQVRELSSFLLPPRNIRIDGVSMKFTVAELRYALSILLGLRARLALGDDNFPEYAVDIVGVEVGFLKKHPKADKLWIARVGTEHFSFTVVTNISDIKKGEIRGIAILPPIIFFEVVSEAMFCSASLDASYKGKRVPVNLINRAEVSNAVKSIVKKLK
ncbi:MAG: tRNA-binding protein [Ignisphaera sp.]